jgi:hypothetical protein
MNVDMYGQERRDDGTISSHHLSMGTHSEQWAAGVNEWDGPFSAEAKVRAYRQNHGFDPATGAPLYFSSGSGGAGAGTIFRVIALLFFLLVVPLVGVGVWKISGQERLHLANQIEAWSFGKAIEGEQFAPIANYAPYAAVDAPVAMSPPDLAEKATSLRSKRKDKSVSDKTLAKWGYASWVCLSENPGCLKSARFAEKGATDLRLLGLLFLDYAQRKGSPDAGADLGLYLAGTDAPRGKDPWAAQGRWASAAEANPEAVRAKALLETAESSLWSIGGRNAATILRAGI